jgi:hypothetical protein
MPIHLRIHRLFRAQQQGDKSSARGLICAPRFGVNSGLAATGVTQRDWIAEAAGFNIR